MIFKRVGKFILSTALLCAGAAAANAATYTVTTTADSGAGSLRQAVASANATADNDTIVFNIPAAACNTTTGICTITLTSGEIPVANNGSLTIQGTGANGLTISGNNTGRLFNVSGASFTLSGATLTGGNITGAGAGGGGAISVSGGTTVLQFMIFRQNSFINGFMADGGGAVYFNGGANHRIENSTFDRNSADNNQSGGGGFFATDTAVSVTNSTFSGNTANSGGGGGGAFAYNFATVTVRSTTISGNSGRFGGGIFAANGSMTLGNSIVAGNTATQSGTDIYDFGGASSSGYNLIGSNEQANNFPAGNPNVNRDIVGTNAALINPLLDPLAYYGGTTQTRRLQTGSPAIDKGGSFGSTADQRGFLRQYDNPAIPNAAAGDGTDIGAYEVQVATAAGASISGRVISNGKGLAGARIELTGTGGVTRTVLTNAFGNFTLSNVDAGATYVINVAAKKYTFAPQVVSVTDSISGLTFTAQ